MGNPNEALRIRSPLCEQKIQALRERVMQERRSAAKTMIGALVVFSVLAFFNEWDKPAQEAFLASGFGPFNDELQVGEIGMFDVRIESPDGQPNRKIPIFAATQSFKSFKNGIQFEEVGTVRPNTDKRIPDIQAMIVGRDPDYSIVRCNKVLAPTYNLDNTKRTKFIQRPVCAFRNNDIFTKSDNEFENQKGKQMVKQYNPAFR